MLCRMPSLHSVAGLNRHVGAPVWLELKAGKGKLRLSQVAWRAKAERSGIRVATARTLDEAIEALR